MDVLRGLASEGATPGTTVLAGFQSAGRGRLDRQWVAPPWSSVLMSFLTRSRHGAESLGLLSLVWGVAVARTVEAFTNTSATIKWPNDVQVDGRKIAGILVLNTAVRGAREYRQVTGIGLNCLTDRADLPETGTSLKLETAAEVQYEEVLKRLLIEVNSAFARYEAGDILDLVREVEQRLAYRGEEVTIQDGDRLLDGVVRGIHPSGALQMEMANGQTRSVVAGELTRGPRPAR